MTNNEQKAKKIVDSIFSSGFNTNRTFYEMAYNSAMEMAEWKEQQMIDKACEWLIENYPTIDGGELYIFIKNFRQAMEEQQ